METFPGFHLDARVLAAYAKRRLRPQDAEAVATHLQGCPGCRAHVDQVSPGGSVSFPSTIAPSTGVPLASPEVPQELVSNPKYRVVRKLGQGGMGAVFLAEHLRMGRMVALKVIDRTFLYDTEMLTRFFTEVKAVSRLVHPNIVMAYDADTAGDVHVLVMEYIEGIGLDKYLRRKGPLPVRLACNLARQAALGLHHAHRQVQPIFHRDVKPSNLLLMRSGQAKIVDFGLARLGCKDVAGRVTRTGATLGTPRYTSPEQARDARRADARSDIYSLGVTLYEMLAGKPPFTGTSPVDVMIAHVQQDAEPLQGQRSDVPANLSAVVARMLAKDPGQRYQTAEEVAKALLPWCRGERPPVRNRQVVEVELNVRGKWSSRPADAPHAEWVFIRATPGKVTLKANEVYQFAAEEADLSGLVRLQNLAALHTLDLSGLAVTDAGLFPLHGLTALKSLDLSRCAQLTDGGLTQLGGLTSLQKLDLEDCERVTDAGLAHLGGLASLQSLDLGGCKRVTDAGLAHLDGLTSLRSLDLGGCKRVTDAGLTHLRGLASLRSLDLSYCKQVTDAGLAHLGGLASLRSLSLRECDQVTDGGLAHLGGLASLQKLDLGWCKQVTDGGLAHLGGLTSLRSLDLEDCDRVTDAGLAHLGKITSLQSLNLSWGPRVTDAGLAHLGGLTSLQSLDLGGCPEVTDAGLAHLRGLTSLRSLELTLCQRVTDAGLAHLRGLPSLQSLILTGCEQVTKAGVTAL